MNGQARIVEGLAMPREEDEFALSYYNSNTCWIDVEKLLAAFQLTRADLADANKVTDAMRALASKLPTYVTLKDVKKRWGHGQEDIFPVAQFEKLWTDMTALPEINCRLHRRAAPARPATQGPIASRRLAARRLGRARREPVRVEVVKHRVQPQIHTDKHRCGGARLLTSRKA